MPARNTSNMESLNKSPETGKPTVRLEFVTASNFGPISKAKIPFDKGEIFVVAGANGAGKTHVSAWMFDILKGKFPGDPLKEDGGLLLNGRAIETAATSEVAISALNLELRDLEGLRFIHFDASYLDNDNAERVLVWLKDQGFQACIEIAERKKENSELRIVVADKYFSE